MMQNSWTNHLAFALHQLVIQVLQMIGPDDASCLPLQDVFCIILNLGAMLRSRCATQTEMHHSQITASLDSAQPASSVFHVELKTEFFKVMKSSRASLVSLIREN